jgi:hypothetical protein
MMGIRTILFTDRRPRMENTMIRSIDKVPTYQDLRQTKALGDNDALAHP